MSASFDPTGLISFLRSPHAGWQGRANAFRKIGRTVGRLRRIVNQGPSSQLLERQRRVYGARIVEVTVDQAVEKTPDVKPSGPSSCVRITNDIYGAVVAQQVIELRPIGQLVDPRQIDQQ